MNSLDEGFFLLRFFGGNLPCGVPSAPGRGGRTGRGSSCEGLAATDQPFSLPVIGTASMPVIPERATLIPNCTKKAALAGERGGGFFGQSIRRKYHNNVPVVVK